MMKSRDIYPIVMLVGLYITFQLIADVTATKIVDIAGITLPAGTFIFALTFTWRDALHKRLGREWARAAIITAAAANIVMALYFWLAIGLPPAPFWGGQDSFAAVLGFVPRITAASIIAEVISELLDTEVYHVLARRIPGRHQWLRVLGSNGISLPVDSAVFVTLAFAGTMPAAGLVSIALGQIAFKMAVTVVSIPLIYLVRDGRLSPAAA